MLMRRAYASTRASFAVRDIDGDRESSATRRPNNRFRLTVRRPRQELDTAASPGFAG